MMNINNIVLTLGEIKEFLQGYERTHSNAIPPKWYSVLESSGLLWSDVETMIATCEVGMKDTDMCEIRQSENA